MYDRDEEDFNLDPFHEGKHNQPFGEQPFEAENGAITNEMTY